MKRLNTILYVILLSVGAVYAQVNVSVRLDSVGFFVGQQDGIELRVVMDSGQHLQLPRIKKGDILLPDVEVIDVLKTDTQRINDGRRLEISQKYIITAWDSSLYRIPPFKVKVDDRVYESNPLAVKVLTVDVDTLHADKIFPPRDLQQVPFCWDDWKGIIYSVLGIVILSGLAVYVARRMRNGKPVFSIIRIKKKLPPHQVALTEIEQIKTSRSWDSQEDNKEYYTRLTDTLRTYIQARYGFSAMEMTSGEIIQNLKEKGDSQSLSELRNIFSTADLVKFARFQPYNTENDNNLMAALRYINDTKVEADEQPEPEVVRKTDHERLHQVIVTHTIIILTVIICIGLSGWIVYRLYDLLS